MISFMSPPVAMGIALLVGLYLLRHLYFYLRAKTIMKDIPDMGILWYMSNVSAGTVFTEADKVKKPIFKSWVGSTPMVFVHEPALAKEVLRRPDDFIKDVSGRIMKGTINFHMMNGSLNNLDGEDWVKLSKKVTPSFHFSSIKRVSPVFTNLASKMFELIDKERAANPDAPIDVNSWFRRYTVDVLGEAALGSGFSALEGTRPELTDAYSVVLEQLLNPVRMLVPWLDWIPCLPLIRKNLHARDVLQNFFRELVAKRRNAPKRDEESPPDVLDTLLEAYDAGVLNDETLLSNILLIYIAGHDTTQSALSWAVYHMCHNPEVQERLHAEVTKELQDRVPVYDDIPAMPYLNQFINEVLRYSSIVSLLPTRSAARDTKIGGYNVVKGALISIDICSIHHDEKNYQDALTFDPDRFSPARKKQEGKKHPYSFLPFSLGPRQCTGAKFSTTEQALLLAMLVRRYKFSLPDESKVTRDMSNPILNNLTKLPVVLQRR